jgi:hypothetical protein
VGDIPSPDPTEHLRFDHVLLATSDLSRAAAMLQDRFGLASVEGGHHPGWGTANRIVPVGDAYLELLTVADEAIARRSAFGRRVTELRSQVLRPIGWAVRTASIDAIATHNALTVDDGSRTTPNGESLHWRIAGLSEAMAEPSLPFFIEWGEGTPHPSTATPNPGVALARLELRGDGERLARWLDGEHLPIDVHPGAPGVGTVALTTPSGEVTIDSTLA